MAELEVIIGGDSRDLAKEIDKVEKPSNPYVYRNF